MLSWVHCASQRLQHSIVIKFLAKVVSHSYIITHIHIYIYICIHVVFLCQFAFSQYVIPTYFLTLPNSVREEMFGITLLCDLFMLDSLLVCRRSSHGLPLALFCFLVLGPAMPTVHVTVHPQGLHPTEAARAWHLHVETRVQTHFHSYLYDIADIFGFVEHHLSPR